jgi:hypothetical protein
MPSMPPTILLLQHAPLAAHVRQMMTVVGMQDRVDTSTTSTIVSVVLLKIRQMRNASAHIVQVCVFLPTSLFIHTRTFCNLHKQQQQHDNILHPSQIHHA